jgi:predicted nucleic acid-binding protein
MVLVDTSVWINHFRHSDPALAELLDEGSVLTHSFILGELACGNLENRQAIFRYFRALPAAVEATHAEVLHFIEQRKLWGKGIGWVDAHLLTSAVLSESKLWTHDGALLRTAGNVALKPASRQ